MEPGTRVIKRCLGELQRGDVLRRGFVLSHNGRHVQVAWDDLNTEYRDDPLWEWELAKYISQELPLIDQSGLWFDIRDGHGELFNTVRAKDSQDALIKSNRQAHLIGIHGSRMNPSGAYAELTPSKGLHPF
jgi:hypothetical protein